MTFAVGPEHAAAQLAATIVFSDAGANASRILLYASAQPVAGAEPGAAPLAEITLSKPCGTLMEGVLTLHPADAGGVMVLQQGIPRWGRWLSGEGKLVADGTVTDSNHAGDFQITGAGTAAGETSPMLYAGGMVMLGALTLT